MDIEKIFLSMERELKMEMYQITPCFEDVEDMYQEAFIKVRRFKQEGRTFQGNRKSIGYLLRLMVRNMMIDQKRKDSKMRMVEIKDYFYAQNLETPEKILIDEEEAWDEDDINKKLNAAFKDMPDVILETYKLRISGLPFKEVARRMGAKITTTQGRMRNAINRIAKQFDDGEV